MFSDLDRPPLSQRSLNAAVAGPSGPWRAIEVVQRTGSTNADLVARALAGEAAGLVLVAEEQTGGRGRLDRSWVAPARSGLTFSVLLRPDWDPVGWGWLPLLTGLAVAEAVTELAGVEVVLKWPNDLLVGDRKLGGILGERAGSALVLGVGLNVTARADELPVASATSLALEHASSIDRAVLLRGVLRRLAERYAAVQSETQEQFGGSDVFGDELRAAYRKRCSTIGRRVRVELPGAATLEGDAVEVDDSGCLVVRPQVVGAGSGAGATVTVAAGDVVHVR